MREKKGITAFSKCGIPRDVLSTTLLKENREDLRQYVESGNASREGAVTIIQSGDNPAKADRGSTLLYLIAKELVLLDTAVYCVTLPDLVAVISNRMTWADAGDVFEGLDEAQVICVDGAFGAGDPFFSRDIQYFASSYLMKQARKGKSLLLSAHGPIHGWWPPNFVGFLEKNAQTFLLA